MADLVRVPVLQGGAGASARVMRKAREKVGLREVEIDGLVRFPPPPPFPFVSRPTTPRMRRGSQAAGRGGAHNAIPGSPVGNL